MRACLLLFWLPLAAAAQPGGVIMQFGGNVQFGAASAKPEKMPEPRGDLLEFVDGSALHGSLARMDLEHGLAWAAPAAAGPIHFRPDHIDVLRFTHAESVSVAPSCHLWFGNGDDLYGSLRSLDDQRLDFNTWFGGDMVIPRAAVRAITFLSSNYSVAYEGPYDTGGWVVVNNSPKSWSFHDGAFVGAGAGLLGRELHLTNSTTVEFDLALNNYFTLEIGVYCDVTDRLDFNGGSCVVNLTPQKVSLAQAQNMGVTLAPLNAPGLAGEGKNRMRVAIECDKSEGTISVFINHVLARTWKDCRFTGGGTGIVFLQRTMFSNATLKLNHLKVSQWEGRCEPENAPPPANSDAMNFVNHDRAAGKIQSIRDGKARLALANAVLDIPLERVTRMEFAGSEVPAETPGPWQVRAHFPGGGSLSFQLEKWNDQAVSGRSALFGALAFQPNAIREMEFNLNRPKQDTAVMETKEFEELDE